MFAPPWRDRWGGGAKEEKPPKAKSVHLKSWKRGGARKAIPVGDEYPLVQKRLKEG